MANCRLCHGNHTADKCTKKCILCLSDLPNHKMDCALHGHPACRCCKGNHMTADCPSSSGVRYRSRTERLAKLVGLKAPFQIVADECVLVLLATVGLENPDLNPNSATDRFRIYDKLVERIQAKKLLDSIAVNEVSKPM